WLSSAQSQWFGTTDRSVARSREWSTRRRWLTAIGSGSKRQARCTTSAWVGTAAFDCVRRAVALRRCNRKPPEASVDSARIHRARAKIRPLSGKLLPYKGAPSTRVGKSLDLIL